jgi:hypothetical protein
MSGLRSQEAQATRRPPATLQFQERMVRPKTAPLGQHFGCPIGLMLDTLLPRIVMFSNIEKNQKKKICTNV